MARTAAAKTVIPGIHADGSLDVRRVGGAPPRFFHDLYHYLLTCSWWRLLLLFAIVYLAANLLFTATYLLGGDCIENARPGNFADAFFFSVQTLSTIGYGGMGPKNLYANVVVTVEVFLGMMAFALATGLVFAKFARPSARVLFAERVVFGTMDGQPTLKIRMANMRGNNIYEASLRVALLRDTTTSEGESMRRLIDLELVRSQTPSFTLSWTAIHIIDESSPLYGLDENALRQMHALLLVSLAGTDETFAQSVHARHIYDADHFAWNARFADVLLHDPNGKLLLDYRRMHDVESLIADEEPEHASKS